jgi:hypothetical protein
MKIIQKSENSVMKAVEIAFNKMPQVFGAIELCDKTRLITGRIDLMDQTTMRKFRRLRQKGVINYSCVDNTKALYQKL